MIPQKPDLKNRRGQVLAEQAFVLAAIVGIVLVVISRLGFETSAVFDQLSMTLPRASKDGSSGKQPAGKRGKRPSSTPAMAGASATAASKTPGTKARGARSRRGAGGGGIGPSKRARDDTQSGSVSYGVTSTSSGVLSIFIGGR